jgi:peptidoglycan/xylan/chitin deacetylase (PgdA/CDA1 family)
MLRPVVLVSLLGKLIAVVLWSFASCPRIATGFFFGPDIFLLYHHFVPSAQGLCRVFTRFATDRAEIWLTIDDGPDPDDTPRILELLDRHQARATFFLIGARAARWPELVVEILRRGHEVAHHTHTHPVATFWCASPARINSELDDALVALRTAGASPRRFRPPVGIKNIFLADALKARGLQCVGWSVRSGDCQNRRAETVVATVVRRLAPGAIILVHEGPSVSRAVRVRAIELLLEALAARKFTCVVPAAERLR